MYVQCVVIKRTESEYSQPIRIHFIDNFTVNTNVADFPKTRWSVKSEEIVILGLSWLEVWAGDLGEKT